MDEFRILSSTAILGYGFPESSFEAGLKLQPHVIAVDAGSTDPGPWYLGAGVSFTDRAAVKRDLQLMIEGGLRLGVPVVVGSSGGCGGAPHLDWTVDIVREIAAEGRLSFRMAVIHAELSVDEVLAAQEDGRIEPLHPAPELDSETLRQTARVVGQMGMEPFISALDAGAQVILAGRAYDPAVFAAVAVRAGFDKGLAIHLGKILECAAIASTPGSGSDCMFGWLYPDRFEVEPLNPVRACTTRSVAAHTLYEKTDPYHLPGPGGELDLTGTVFEQVTDRRVAVRGSRYIPAKDYTIKLEGVRRIGSRTVSVAGARDPVMISQIDSILSAVRERVADNFSRQGLHPASDGRQDGYHLNFRLYGQNGVMGSLEPVNAVAHELGIIIEAVAPTQEQANTVCSFARSTMLHYGYPGRVSTAGNLAFPFSPSDFKAGDVYVFSVYHLIRPETPLSLFPVECMNFFNGEVAE